MRAAGPASALPGEKRKQKKINIDEAEGKKQTNIFFMISLLVDFCAFALPSGLSVSDGRWLWCFYRTTNAFSCLFDLISF